jgi:hypothetical protein
MNGQFIRHANGLSHQTYFEPFLGCKFRSSALVRIVSSTQSDGGGDARHAAAAICHMPLP